MDVLFTAVSLLLSALSLTLSVGLLWTSCRRRPDTTPQSAPASSDELRREQEQNQGVENILRYSVPLGRGKTTGGDAL